MSAEGFHRLPSQQPPPPVPPPSNRPNQARLPVAIDFRLTRYGNPHFLTLAPDYQAGLERV